jgi:hypothetical protein
MSENANTEITATAKNVKEFFGMNLAEMKAEWMTLGQDDRNDILRGLSDGSLNY